MGTFSIRSLGNSRTPLKSERPSDRQSSASATSCEHFLSPVSLANKTRPTHFPQVPQRQSSIPFISSLALPKEEYDRMQSDQAARHTSGQAGSVYDRRAQGTSDHDPTADEDSTTKVSTRSGHIPDTASINHQVVVTHRREKSVTRPEHNPQTPIVITPSVDTHPYARHHRAPASRLTSPSSSSVDVQSIIQSPPENSLADLHALPPPRRASGTANMRSSPLNPHSQLPMSADTGYDTSSSAPDSYRRIARGRPPFAPDILDEMPEIHDHEAYAEAQDTVSSMRDRPAMLELLQRGLGYTNGSHSSASITSASKPRMDQVLGLDPHAKLASFYLVSGLPRNYPDWSPADTEATQGLNPSDDSLGLFWRADILGSAFSGQKNDDLYAEMRRNRVHSKSSHVGETDTTRSKSVQGVKVPDAGPDGAQKLIHKTLKYAHPRDVEVINHPLQPPTTCHAFTFTIPKHDTLAAVARTPFDNRNANTAALLNQQSTLSPEGAAQSMLTQPDLGLATARNLSATSELTFHGMTLTVWTHADKDKGKILRWLRARKEGRAEGRLDSLRSSSMLKPRAQAEKVDNGKRRGPIPWALSRKGSHTDMSASETDMGISDSDFEGPSRRRSNRPDDSRNSLIDSVVDDGVLEDGTDIFWMPFAITMVSRHPIYDFMQDYLRLSWTRYQKNAKGHMLQMCRALNHDTPRPGQIYHIPITSGADDTIIVEAVMPGVDFDSAGITKVDFQMWPLFQALDIDHVLTCIEIALSNSGRVVFCSKHPAMLNVCVSSLQYLVDLRNWKGIALPMLHARDVSLIVEDPGPYILGMPTECRYMVTFPSEVVIVDIDTNTITCATPPAKVLSTRAQREKVKQRIFAAFGADFPLDRSIPMEFKATYPRGTFRNINKVMHNVRPAFLGERLRAPNWYKHLEIVKAFDRVMLEKKKKPTLLQRLTKSGMSRQQAQLTVGEKLAKTMMRRRALHYVETRDDLEVKVAKINRKLQKLTQEGEHWRKQFEKFELYADRLTHEANELKLKIDRERREAKRLSSIASEQTKANIELEKKLENTESARAEAMRKLSDMNQSIQELEKEREEIMNLFETQINHALEGYAGILGEDGSRPGTPTGSVIESPLSRFAVLGKGSRPDTRDSNKSTMSKYTSVSTLSVLGAARGPPPGAYKNRRDRPATSSTTDRTHGDEKVDAISQRIASIQAKLDLALSTVQRSDSTSSIHTMDGSDVDVESDRGKSTANDLSLENIGANEEEADDDAATTTPVASRQPSAAELDKQPPVPLRNESLEVEVDPETPHTPLSPEYYSANESLPYFFVKKSTEGKSDANNEFPPTNPILERKSSSPSSSLGLSLGRPGIGDRMKRCDESRSSSVVSTEDLGHGKMSTKDSGISEVLVSPSTSEISLTSISSGGSGRSSGSETTTGVRSRARATEGGEVRGDGVRRAQRDQSNGVKMKRLSGASAFGRVAEDV